MRAFLGSTTGLVACLIVAAVGGWLLWSHTGHVLSALPFLVLLACPLMHLMHRGHGRHGSEHDKSENPPADGKSGKQL
jgi:4-amino-4-deoxy-L-arabinose transferase-like glycosyltransferase